MTSNDAQSVKARLDAAVEAHTAGDTATALGRLNEAQRELREIVARMVEGAGAHGKVRGLR